MCHVKIYDVGKSQLQSFIDAGTVIVPMYANYPICIDTYCIVFKAAWFGGMQDGVTMWPGYQFDEAVRALPRSVDWNEDECGFAFVRHIELWRVVDDDDLWLAWDSEVAYTRLGGVPCRYKVMDGSQCVACVDHVPTNVYVIVGMHGGDKRTYDHYFKADDFGDALAMCETHGSYIMRACVTYGGEPDCSITVRDVYTDDYVDASVTVLLVWVREKASSASRGHSPNEL